MLIQYLSAPELNDYAQQPLIVEGALMVMPFIHSSQAQQAAQLMSSRADAPGMVLAIHDVHQVGFAAIINTAFKVSQSPYFGYARYPEKFKSFNTPDPSYHGLVYAQALGVGSAFGANLSYIFKIRLTLLRDIGAAVSPFNAWLLAQGLETLSLRLKQHLANAKEVATWLDQHPQVESVNYASLPSNKYNALASKYAPKGSGAVLSFEIKGGIEAGKKFVEALTLHSHVANIGDVRSLVIHPASTTHSQLSAAEQLTAGVTPGLIRLSVGLEDIEDIKADLAAGFAAAK